MEYKKFLKSTLPHLGLRWRRFRRKSIRRRIVARLLELNLHSLSEYHSYLLDNAEERRQLTGLLTVTISRFWRNASLFEALEKYLAARQFWTDLPARRTLADLVGRLC